MKKRDLAVLWVGLGTLARIIPHPANMTPMTSLSLFAGSQLSKFWAFAAIILSMLASDLMLSSLHGHEAFGYWSLFTYSGFLAVVFLGFKLKGRLTALRTFGFTLSATLSFWLWTNFGVWAASAMYSKTLAGLIACYGAALPFLRYALIGDLVWAGIFFVSFASAKKVFMARKNILAA